jgi:hypothetical protein
MPLQATSGAASYDAFGGGVPVVPAYIEEVFSTYLYVGDGTNGRAITNNIDLSTKGGLVWVKSRTNVADHDLCDTVRGATKKLKSNGTDAQNSMSDVTAFSTTGFTIGDVSGNGNSTGANIASWTFRKQPKFFDVVTFTTNSSGDNYAISHSLGSRPGFIIVKRTDATSAWYAGHKGASVSPDNFDYNLKLNTTGANIPYAIFQSVDETSFQFIGSADPSPSGSLASGTFVAYLFAHNAGGFGLTGTDNVISCGSFTSDGSGNATVSLGYEPQWVLYKRSDSSTGGSWHILDSMRGLTVTTDNQLVAQTSDAETTGVSRIAPSATGFYNDPSGLVSNATYIYIAIRRGPMKVPTIGTTVFSPLALNNSTGTTNTTNFPIDLQINAERGGVHATPVVDRLRGVVTVPADDTSVYSRTDSTAAEQPDTITRYWNNTGFETSLYSSGVSSIYWNFRRAPSFFDEVCYNGDGTDNRAITHNLTVAPEFIIAKRRDGIGGWTCYCKYITGGASSRIILQSNAASVTSINDWAATNPTSTNFYISSTGSAINNSGNTYASYLFSTCAGVSKVGSYTGNGTTQTIDCGFGAGGARFVLIKRTNSTGDWYVYDTARGMTLLTDPYLLLNSTAAETATLGSVTTVATGFAVDSTILAAINVNAGTYIFLAIA